MVHSMTGVFSPVSGSITGTPAALVFHSGLPLESFFWTYSMRVSVGP